MLISLAENHAEKDRSAFGKKELNHGIPDNTLHNFTEDTGEADGPVIPRVPLTPLLKDWANISSSPDCWHPSFFQQL